MAKEFKLNGSLVAKISLDDFQTVDVKLIGGDGSEFLKTITLKEYIKILKAEKENWEDIPRLPMGTVRTQWKNEKYYRTLVFVPGDVRPTIFLGKPLLVPFPNLGFYFEINNGSLSKSCVYSLKEGFYEITDESKLYHFPYGNVYTSDGHICWGGNRIPSIKEPLQLEKVIRLFFDAPMNTDLYSQGISNKKKVPLEEFLTEMVDKDSFESKLLQENGQKLGSLFK